MKQLSLPPCSYWQQGFNAGKAGMGGEHSLLPGYANGWRAGVLAREEAERIKTPQERLAAKLLELADISEFYGRRFNTDLKNYSMRDHAAKAADGAKALLEELGFPGPRFRSLR